MTSQTETKWQNVASKLYTYMLYDEIRLNRGLKGNESTYNNLYQFISELTDNSLYGKYILENYTKEDIEELEKEIKEEQLWLPQ